jgi:hypothetical protein
MCWVSPPLLLARACLVLVVSCHGGFHTAAFTGHMVVMFTVSRSPFPSTLSEILRQTGVPEAIPLDTI